MSHLAKTDARLLRRLALKAYLGFCKADKRTCCDVEFKW